MADETIQIDQGYIKLYKNETAKAVKYNWEIKVYNSLIDEDLIELVKDLNAKMEEKFPLVDLELNN